MASRGALVQNAVSAAIMIGGGAAAGYADGHFADKQIAGQSYGTVGGAAALAIGLLGVGGSKISGLATKLGAGALAGEAYKFANKKGSSDGAVHGVGAAPSQLPRAARVVTPQEIGRIYSTIGRRG